MISNLLGEKIGRKSPEEYRINPLCVHYQCSLYFFVGTQLNTSFGSREFTNCPYRCYLGYVHSDWVLLLEQVAMQAEEFHFLASKISRGEWCHQLGTLWGLIGSLIALKGCFLLCWLFWINFKSFTDFRKHIHPTLLGSYGNPHTAAHSHCDVKSMVGGHFGL